MSRKLGPKGNAQISQAKWHTTNTTTPLVTIANTYVYDNMGRKLQTTEAIANGSAALPNAVVVSQTDYNETGQVSDKQLHSTDGSTFVAKDSYTYNERGWLLSNITQSGTNTLFSEQLQYNTADAFGLTGYAKQYNGNIASQTWKNGTGGTQRSSVYAYDALNRLISGIGTGNNNENAITYDLNGNIQALNRSLNSAVIDQLTYAYLDASSNYSDQVQKITDNSSSDVGFKHGASGFTYAYDGNGNMTTDNSKSLTLTYNLLNLPQTMTITGTNAGTVTYTYDAGGTKLRKVNTQGAGTTTDYIGGIEYDATGTNAPALTFIQTEEGRALPTGSTYNYEYNLSDHLGDIRYTFDTHIAGTATPIQQDDYLPFGMDISITTTSPPNNYLYNKKELQQETNLYDYGARFYDPVIGRWTSVDPLAEHDRRWSPYNYGLDNPIRFIDPDGMGWMDNVVAYAKGLANDLSSAANGISNLLENPAPLIYATDHPHETLTRLKVNGAIALGKTIKKLSYGTKTEKYATAGMLTGEGLQLFGGGELGDVSKLGDAAKVENVTKDVFVVTKDGVALPKGDKYAIPDNYVENPNRSSSYGITENGKYKEELRIDPATEPGKKGPNTSHYHRGGKSTHYVPDGKDPGFKPKTQ